MVKHDVSRIIFSSHVPIAVITIVGIFLFAAFDLDVWDESVIKLMAIVSDGIENIAILSVLSYVAGFSFAEDFEKGYIYPVLTHTTLKKYTVSKVFMILVSTMLVMTAATFLFVGFLRLTSHAWYDGDVYMDGLDTLECWELEKDGHHILFYGRMGMQYGMLGGVLALFSAWISLYANNRTLVVTLPVVMAYLLRYYFHPFGETNNILIIFEMFRNDTLYGKDYLWKACIIAGGLTVLLSVLIYRRLREKVYV